MCARSTAISMDIRCELSSHLLFSSLFLCLLSALNNKFLGMAVESFGKRINRLLGLVLLWDMGPPVCGPGQLLKDGF